MHKHTRHTTAALPAGTFTLGQACTAFAVQDDSNYGPAFGITKLAQVLPSSEQAPGDNQIQAAPQETQPQEARPQRTQGTPAEVLPGNDAAANTQADANAMDVQAATEQTTATEEAAMQAAIIVNMPYLQIQALRSDTTRSRPVIGDVLLASEGGFRSLCICLNNIVGNVLYRTYTNAHGWSEWVMNGGHTTVWGDGSLVETIQIHPTGFVGNTFGVYYSPTLSDGAKLNRARNGQTARTMGTDKVMQNFHVLPWGRNADGTIYSTTKPVETAAPDSIQTTDGAVVYSSNIDIPFTERGWNDRNRYYFINSAPITGWQYIGGYKHYSDETGKMVTNPEPILGTTSPFLTRINRQVNTTTVHVQDDGNDFITPLKASLCSTGEGTPLGTSKTPEEYRWRLINSGVYTQYTTRLGSGLSPLLHSIIYDPPNVNTLKSETYNLLDAIRSAGYIHYASGDSKWIFNHCSLSTTVEVYSSSTPDSYDRPVIEQPISVDQHQDPTDSAAVATLNVG